MPSLLSLFCSLHFTRLPRYGNIFYKLLSQNVLQINAEVPCFILLYTFYHATSRYGNSTRYYFRKLYKSMHSVFSLFCSEHFTTLPRYGNIFYKLLSYKVVQINAQCVFFILLCTFTTIPGYVNILYQVVSYKVVQINAEISSLFCSIYTP